MTLVLAVTALAVSGLMVGVELAVAGVMNPILDRLPGDVGVAGRADAARTLGRIMPFWYAGSVLLVVAYAVAHRGDGGGAAVAAAVCFTVGVVLSVVLLVPINTRVATWTPQTAPAGWRDEVRRWDRLHVVRVGVLVAGFVLLAGSLA